MIVYSLGVNDKILTVHTLWTQFMLSKPSCIFMVQKTFGSSTTRFKALGLSFSKHISAFGNKNKLFGT